MGVPQHGWAVPSGKGAARAASHDAGALVVFRPEAVYTFKTTSTAAIDAAPTTTTLPVTSILRLGIGPSGKHSRVSRATREPSPQRHDNSPWKRPRLIEIASQEGAAIPICGSGGTRLK